MNVLIVYAHPEPQSFCGALKEQARTVLDAAECTVDVSDLYAMRFNPILDRHDFTTQKDSAFFKPQTEQIYASEHAGFAADVAAEQQKVAQADIILFYFPLWWFALPAIMKGWADRVLAMNVAYGGTKGLYAEAAFTDKKTMLVITTGGGQDAYTPTSRNDDIMEYLFPIHYGILAFCGMQVMEPFVAYGPARLTAEERQTILDKHASALKDLASRPLLTFKK